MNSATQKSHKQMPGSAFHATFTMKRLEDEWNARLRHKWIKINSQRHGSSLSKYFHFSNPERRGKSKKVERYRVQKVFLCTWTLIQKFCDYSWFVHSELKAIRRVKLPQSKPASCEDLFLWFFVFLTESFCWVILFIHVLLLRVFSFTELGALSATPLNLKSSLSAQFNVFQSSWNVYLSSVIESCRNLSNAIVTRKQQT